jgi:hypothetical protein
MRNGLKIFLVALALVFGAQAGKAADHPLAVVELFTSQGCSSCPPADAFLGELAKRDDVLALSFHVDYWDYIGWKDPYASAKHTERQRHYARRFGMRYVYTPQMVIQGRVQATGSNRGAVLDGIEKNRRGAVVPVELRNSHGDEVIVSIPDGAAAESATVWLVVFDREHETAVKRGENRGRTVRNYNVVRRLSRIGTWTGKAMEIPVKVPRMASGAGDACAVIVQARRTGYILGAAVMPLGQPR